MINEEKPASYLDLIALNLCTFLPLNNPSYRNDIPPTTAGRKSNKTEPATATTFRSTSPFNGHLPANSDCVVNLHALLDDKVAAESDEVPRFCQHDTPDPEEQAMTKGQISHFFMFRLSFRKLTDLRPLKHTDFFIIAEFHSHSRVYL